jgi:hypothetical protein
MARWANENVFDAAIHEAALKYGVPSELIKAVIAKESGFNHRAVRPEPAYKCALTGKVGDASIGLMQILHCTAMGEGFRGTVEELYEPYTNIDYGTRYLANQLHQASGYVPGGVSAYNGGWNPNIGFGAAVTRAGITVCLARDTKTGKCISSRTVPIGEYANQPYVDSVMANYQYFRNESVKKPPGNGTPSPPLTVAHRRAESESDGPISRPVVGPTRTPIREGAVKNQFHVAAGKKWVTIAGLVITGLGLLCLDHRTELNEVMTKVWADRLCGAVALVGTVVASFGKGLADRRTTRPEDNGYIGKKG